MIKPKLNAILRLPNDISLLNECDASISTVYSDKYLHHLTALEISEYRCIRLSEVIYKLKIAHKLLTNKQTMWLYGLSGRAINAIIKQGYSYKLQLTTDVANTDIELWPNIGHQTAVEIRKWCNK